MATALADALTCSTSYVLWLERMGRVDHPGWRNTWAERPSVERARFVEGLKVERVAPVRLGPRDAVRLGRG